MAQPEQEREPECHQQPGALEQACQRLVEVFDRLVEEVEAHRGSLHRGQRPTIGKCENAAS